jgi:hypothetical protein
LRRRREAGRKIKRRQLVDDGGFLNGSGGEGIGLGDADE